eukprot:366013-Chlamydomonas_euryale.AAC.6
MRRPVSAALGCVQDHGGRDDSGGRAKGLMGLLLDVLLVIKPRWDGTLAGNQYGNQGGFMHRPPSTAARRRLARRVCAMRFATHVTCVPRVSFTSRARSASVPGVRAA